MQAVRILEYGTKERSSHHCACEPESFGCDASESDPLAASQPPEVVLSAWMTHDTRSARRRRAKSITGDTRAARALVSDKRQYTRYAAEHELQFAINSPRPAAQSQGQSISTQSSIV